VVAIDVFEVDDDSWTELNITSDFRPLPGEVIAPQNIITEKPGWLSIDVTNVTNKVLSNATDNFLSLYFRTSDGYNKDAQIRVNSKEEGNGPTLVLHQDFSTLMGLV